MYNVTIPSIEDEKVIAYLKSTGQIQPWERKKSGKIFSDRPTYRELVEEVNIQVDGKWKWACKWDNNAVFEWHEQMYNERGDPVTKIKKKYFSVHDYGKMIHGINPKKNILLELLSIQGIDGGFNSTDDYDYTKAYIDKKIETPDLFFRNMVALTFNQYEDLEIIFPEDEQSKKLKKMIKNAATRRVLKRVQPVLADMIQKYPTLIIHVNIEKALKISLSYELVKKGKKIVHKWDDWYIRHLLHFAPFFFQRPYYSKRRQISEENNVYLFHMITYQTKFRDGEFWALTNREINQLCGDIVKRIKELTPRGQRIPFNRLPTKRQNLVRQAFGELSPNSNVHVEFVGVIMSRWIDEDLTTYQMKMKPFKEYRKAFDEEFKYRLKTAYILDCIEEKMQDVSWWDDEAMRRLRGNIGRSSAPVQEPPIKKEPTRQAFQPVTYDSSSGDDENDTRKAPPITRNNFDTYSTGDDTGYEDSDNIEETYDSDNDDEKSVYEGSSSSEDDTPRKEFDADAYESEDDVDTITNNVESMTVSIPVINLISPTSSPKQRRKKKIVKKPQKNKSEKKKKKVVKVKKEYVPPPTASV